MPQDVAVELSNPMELVSHFVMRQDWPLRRMATDHMLIEVPGQWAEHQLSVSWREDSEALHLTCRLDLGPLDDCATDMSLLAGLLNSHIWLGHFLYHSEAGEVQLRHTLPLRGAGGASAEQIEDLVDILLGEAEQAWPAFWQLARGEVSLSDAAQLMLLTTAGQA